MMISCSDFAKHALKLELYPKQAEILDSFFAGKYTQATWALGRRCVTADTLIATNNGMLEIGSLANTGKRLDDGWEECAVNLAQPYGESRPASMFYHGGKQDIIRIKTLRGFEIAGTPNHPVMVMGENGIHEWKQLGSLNKNDQVVIRPGANVWPTHNPHIGAIAAKHINNAANNSAAKSINVPNAINEDMAYAIGALVGDGSWTSSSSIELTCHEQDMPFMVDSLHRGLGISFKITSDSRRNSTQKAQYHSRYYRAFLNNLGWVIETKRDQKRIPWVIMRSRKEIVCAFLSGLFDTDGSVEKQGKAISFSTASKMLGREVQMLLLNLGILSKLSPKIVNGKTYWNLSLLGLDARKIFCSEIGFRLPRKQLKALQGLDVVRDGGNTAAIPHQKDQLKKLIKELQCDQKQPILTQLRKAIGNAVKNSGEEFNARRLPGLIRLLDANQSHGEAANHFRNLAKNRLFYDPIVKIQNESPQEVFDFHVPITNAFVANGIVNHNSGKTLMAAVACVYICFVLEDDFKKKVRKGEKWYVLTVANSQDQSRIALNNIRQLILDSPFAQEIVRETADQLEISNGCVFKAIPTSGRAARGLACCACVFDELAFAVDGDANSGGKGIYDALSPAVAQFGGNGKILELSSPWLTDGLFYQHFKEAASGRFPYLQAVNLPTWEMNPTISREFLEMERERDPEKFKVEYGAQFAANLSALIASDVVDACVDDKRHALPPVAAHQGSYVLALDPARGGVGRDNYTACIVHFEGNTLVVDKFHTFAADFEINGRKEVNINAVEDWIKEQHKLYVFDKIVMDQYNSAGTIQALSGELPIEELTWTISSKVKAFSKMRELFNAGLVNIYNHEKALNEIKNLTVVYKAGGQWTVTGGKQTGIDDHAFALAAAIHAADREDDVNWLQDFI